MERAFACGVKSKSELYGMDLAATREGEAICLRVSPEDVNRLSACKWSVARDGYARGWVDGKIQLLHKVVMGTSPPACVVDHVDQNKLNNCRDNLRFVSRSVNAHNVTTTNESGFRGVRNRKQKWQAECGGCYLGVYSTKEEAADAYNREAVRLYGDAAVLNAVKLFDCAPKRVGLPIRELPVGVYKRKGRGFMAALSVDGKFKHMGTFASLAEAQAVIERHNEAVTQAAEARPIIRDEDGHAIFRVNGKVCKVDDEDYKRFLGQPKELSNGYLMCGKRHARQFLHRLILGIPVGDKRVVDHINGDKLNNRRENLRVATQSENIHKRKSASDASGRFRGITKVGARFRATIMKNYKTYHVGVFDTEVDAARARDAKAVELYGDAACVILK